MEKGETVQVGDLFFSKFISRDEIRTQVLALAQRINTDLKGKDPVFIPVLNGSFIFAADLIREVDIPCEVSFVKMASYQGLQTGGTIKEVVGLQVSITGRHVVVVEDIVDTGLTMKHLMESFSRMKPASITIVTLFLKPDALKVELSLPYVGFEIPYKFIVGYGLDYNGLGRNLADIYQKADS